jgi:DNA helicase IV
MAKICTLNKPYPCEDVVGSKCTVCGHAGRNHVYFKEMGMGDYCMCMVCEGTDKEEELYALVCEYRSIKKVIDFAEELEGK